MIKNEQWLLDGDCKICRRCNYCKKDCTRRNRVKEAWLASAVRDALDEATGGALNKIGGFYGMV